MPFIGENRQLPAKTENAWAELKSIIFIVFCVSGLPFRSFLSQCCFDTSAVIAVFRFTLVTGCVNQKVQKNDKWAPSGQIEKNLSNLRSDLETSIRINSGNKISFVHAKLKILAINKISVISNDHFWPNDKK